MRVFTLCFCVSILTLTQPTRVYADICAEPSQDGDISSSGVVNTYWRAVGNPGPGVSYFNLQDQRGASTPISAGDLLMIIQMQDTDFSSLNSPSYGDGTSSFPAHGYTSINDTGRIEFARAKNSVPLSGGSLEISDPSIYGHSDSSGYSKNRRYQIIRVPQFRNLTLTGDLKALPWDGLNGGIVAIDVAGELNFNGFKIDVSETGFRGGGGQQYLDPGYNSITEFCDTSDSLIGGSKGEGIAGTPHHVWDGINIQTSPYEGYSCGAHGRGAPGNAGGGASEADWANNVENGGGGGGAGYGNGGQGGHNWCEGGAGQCTNRGGFGGKGLSIFSPTRVFMGGGGGAGGNNDGTGFPSGGIASSGALGGGIAIIQAGKITGSGSVQANGGHANSTVAQDGSGGGGGGGAILMSAHETSVATITLEAKGGNGGSNSFGEPHGPGGGGGGGYIALNPKLSSFSTNVIGGTAGTTQGDTGWYSATYGAISGAAGKVDSLTSLNMSGSHPGYSCVPWVEKSFANQSSPVNTANTLTLTVSNPHTSSNMTALSFTDNFPTNMVIAPTPNLVSSCAGSVTANPSSSSVSLSGATLGAGSNCTVEVDIIATNGGEFTNEITPGSVTTTFDGKTRSNALAALDTFSVPLPLTANKTATIISDGMGTDYALPGAVVEYAITFTNPGAVPVDAGTIVITDAIPDNTVFVNNDINGAGSGPIVLDNASSAGLSLVAASRLFSSDDASSFSYLPAAGLDPQVTHLRIVPSGAMNPGSTATARFRVQIK